MNKAELIDAVATRLGHSKRDVTDIVDAFIEETKKAVVRGEKVAVSGFGVFEAQARKARLGRNPRTGETVKIKATKLPKFRPGAEFKAVVSGAKKIVSKAPAKKAAPAAKKAAPAKKAPAKKAAPAAKKAAPAKKAPAKKAAPAAKKAAPAKKAPAKKAAAKK
ncbi:MAG: HU family DNA-binding protein [Actinomycetales bacterium]|nr:HU family DNA-binding protein [Actinomycetales bacterium]